MAPDDTIGTASAQAKCLPRPGALRRGFSTLIIQCCPKRSVHMPKRCAKKVCAKGMSTEPSSARRRKMRSASAASSISTLTEKPCGVW